MEELLTRIAAAFTAAGFTVTDQEHAAVPAKEPEVRYAVPKLKKHETSKRVRADGDEYAVCHTFTCAVRCFGKRCGFSDSEGLPAAVSLAANELRGEDGLSLLSLETGELVRDAATDRLTCDLILRAAGYEVYDGWWGE